MCCEKGLENGPGKVAARTGEATTSSPGILLVVVDRGGEKGPVTGKAAVVFIGSAAPGVVAGIEVWLGEG